MAIIKKEIKCTLDAVDYKNEAIIISIYNGKKTIKFVLSYLPHPDRESIKSRIILFENSIKNNITTIILGDFNTHFEESNRKTNKDPNFKKLFKFMTKNQPLFQLVKEPTRENRIIDLIFTNNNEIIKNLVVGPPLSSSDHNILSFELMFDKIKQPTKYVKNFNKLNVMLTKKYLVNNKISQSLINICEISKKFEFFDNIIRAIVANIVPTIKIKPNKQSTYNPRIQHIAKMRFKYWREYRASGDALLKSKYKLYKYRLRSEVKHLKTLKENSIFNSTDKKHFFKYVSIFMKNKQNIPTVMHYKDCSLCNDESICEKFATHFQSIYEQYTTKSSAIIDNQNVLIANISYE